MHILLFLLTVATTTAVGILHYVDFKFYGDSGIRIVDSAPKGFFGLAWFLTKTYYLQGLFYSAAILGILGAHEMGHYAACVYHDVDASLPYFLPAPILTGTFGAVIRVRERFPDRKALFDMGVAGPIAGFLVLVPVLFLGLHLSNIVPMPKPSPDLIIVSFGEPLAFKAIRWLTFGPIPPGYDVNWHPVAFAAWFGMLATAVNLLPFGQFDGGHMTYAVLGDRSRYVSIVTLAAAIVMCFISLNWVLIAVMMLAMIRLVGLRHPPVIFEHAPLGIGRHVVALLVVAIFVVCFMLIPFEQIS